MRLHERLNEDKENIVDRRKVSNDSRRQLAECYHNNEPQQFMSCLFEVVTGDEVDEWEPWRDVEGTLTATDDVLDSLEDNEYLRAEITVGEKTTGTTVREDGDYNVRELEDGEYALSVDTGTLVTEDPETLEIEREDVTVTAEMESETITVDTEATEIAPIEGPEIKVTDYE